MSTEDEAGSCSEEKSEESNNYSPDEQMLYGADSNLKLKQGQIYTMPRRIPLPQKKNTKIIFYKLWLIK